MSENQLYYIDKGNGSLIGVPANRVRLTDLTIDGDKWSWQFRIGQPEEDEL